MAFDPPGTLLRTAAAAVLSGLAASLLAALAIYAACRLLPPGVPRGEVWARWRSRRLVWGSCLILGAAAAALGAEAVGRQIAVRDLYWVGRAGEIFQIARLGAACGFLLGLLLPVVGALAARRLGGRGGKGQGEPGAPPPPAHS